MKSKESGFITLEASICVTIFLLLMFFLSSYFIMFAAQSTTAHVIIESAESLSIDAYRISKVGDKPGEKIDSVQTMMKSWIFDSTDNTNYITSNNNWFTQDTDSLKARLQYIENDFYRDKKYKDGIGDMVKNRFVFFLAGGDETKADDLLKGFKIKDGLDGLDFSESYVEDKVLYANVKYSIVSDFKSVGIDDIEIDQTTCSKLWIAG